jgi:hypothetical protein
MKGLQWPVDWVLAFALAACCLIQTCGQSIPKRPKCVKNDVFHCFRFKKSRIMRAMIVPVIYHAEIRLARITD